MALFGDIFGAGGVAALAGKAVEALTAWIPNPTERAKAAMEVQKALAEHEFELDKRSMDLLQGQMDIDKIEAASPNWFVAGWRPAVGWVCVLGLLYQFLGFPFLCYLSGMMKIAPPPSLDMQTLIALLTGLLGLGALRTKEKLSGVQTMGLRK